MWIAWTLGMQSICSPHLKVKQWRQQRKRMYHAARACSSQKGVAGGGGGIIFLRFYFFFFIFAKGMQLKITTFLRYLFLR